MCRRACDVLNRMQKEHQHALDILVHEILPEHMTFLDVINEILEAYDEEPIVSVREQTGERKFIPVSEYFKTE